MSWNMQGQKIWWQGLTSSSGIRIRGPHGSRIPSRHGIRDDGKGILLSAAPAGAPPTLMRIADTDLALLRYCAGLGLLLGAKLTVVEPFR
nr:hypothetical protein [Arthrobacter sp. Leaf137]